MILFYMTNHPDEDMRKYTYMIISSTISIFCAVLIFFSVQDGVHLLSKTTLGHSLRGHVVVNFSVMVGWNVMLQIVLAWLSGVCAKNYGGRPRPVESARLNLKCFAVLLAHITGFSSIHAWCSLQQLSFFSQSPFMAFSVVPLAVLGQYLIHEIFKLIRERVSLQDNEIDEYEEIWEEMTEDAENDVFALAVSFVIGQSFRYLFGGHLPNAEGIERHEFLVSHTPISMIQLLVTSWVMIACVFSLVFAAHAANDNKRLSRIVTVARGIASMSFAWTFFFSTKWFLAGQEYIGRDQMMVTVVEAMAITFVAFGSISVLDKLADSECTGDETDKAIIQVILSNGLLVGFAWEQSFDKAIEAISSNMHPALRHHTKLGLAIFCVVLIVPAWRLYLLPMEVQEGWKYGFVVDPDDVKLQSALEHPKFKQLVHQKTTDVLDTDRESDDDLESETKGC